MSHDHGGASLVAGSATPTSPAAEEQQMLALIAAVYGRRRVDNVQTRAEKKLTPKNCGKFFSLKNKYL